MQRLERLLSTNMAILAVIGAIMLGLGQQDAKLALLVFVAAIASVVYTDRRKAFSLNHHLANVAALCAVGLALFDYSASDRNQQLLAIANLLVYLQVVVFFQEKNARIFGQLAMLSLLQVVVAAALNYSVLFGILAITYMAIGLPTLSLFFFYRELGRFVSIPHEAEKEIAGNTGSIILSKANVATNEILSNAVPRRWPLAAQVASFTGADFKQHEEAFGRGGLLSFTTRMTGFTLLLTIFIFIFAPRFGRTSWQSGNVEAARIVGYSEEVTLGELGGAVENPETVMRVTFVDEEIESIIRLTGSPLFRGSVVARYDLEKRRWSQYREDDVADPLDLEAVDTSQRGLVRQEIKLEALSEAAVFAVFPVFAKNPKNFFVHYDRNTKQLFREERYRNQTTFFNLWTNGIENTGYQSYSQKKIVPAGAGISEAELNVMRRIPLRVGGSDPFVGLKQVADEAVAASGVDENDSYAVAKALEAFMLSGGNFKYSIEGQVRPNNEVDPIEDFVTRSRVGHCEYFASGLALMLRHRGIPARVVIGFKGGDWNTLGKYYQVRQLHAHAWVEAYLKRDELEGRAEDLGPNDFAAWLTLDSTADTLAVAQQEGDSLWSKTRSLADYVQMQWITYVVGLTREQQQEHIYQPLADVYAEAKRQMQTSSEMGAESPWYVRLYDFLKNVAGGNWFSWRGLILTSGLLLFLSAMAYSLWHAARYLWPLILRVWRPQAAGRNRGSAPEVAFYRQLETLLARHGYHKLPEQTQREFATAAGSRLALKDATQQVSPLPRSVVDAFYAVRFGNRTLDSVQVEAIEQSLAELQTHLAAKPK